MLGTPWNLSLNVPLIGGIEISEIKESSITFSKNTIFLYAIFNIPQSSTTGILPLIFSESLTYDSNNSLATFSLNTNTDFSFSSTLSTLSTSMNNL